MPKTTAKVIHANQSNVSFNSGDLVMNDKGTILMCTGNQNYDLFAGMIVKESIDSAIIGTYLNALEKTSFHQFYGEITLKSQ